MDKLEKVISSIKKCNNNIPGHCDKCPYRGKDTHDCVGELLNDTLELLIEQQQEIDKLNRFINGFSKVAVAPVRCKDCKKNNAYDCSITWTPPDDWFCADGEPKDGEQE